ncbi:MAG TPA: NAD-dependent epimerase/dehydratase family protein [Gemmataceae bacterium]|jgi:nucleoside-diphosphate-sugar epimerase|nr:NAD-dependent epimerase/dehydratase family protein [Gemmataceae bacterium]
MRYLVTGAAGFIGSHLCERLLSLGHEVVGLDCFVPYYPKPLKERNLVEAKKHPKYRFVSLDLRTDDVRTAVEGVDIIFHLAAMPGLVASWTDFDLYLGCNVTATQRLLEAVKGSKSLKRLIYGSTSSVYGKFASGDETLPTKPVSPYGVTKLAGEHLARAHLDIFGTPVSVLRFFSVYGPRQRPDMAYNIFIRALLTGELITVYGDGEQVRGNTFVADCVEAVIASANAPIGETFNIGGGEMVSVKDVLAKLEHIAGKTFTMKTEPARIGDQRHTFADTTKLRRQLGWEPKTTLDEGLALQFEWQKAV